MRASAVSFTHKFIAAALAALLTLTLVPLAHAEGESSNNDSSGVVASALADQSNASVDSFGEFQEVSAEQETEGSLVAPMLASGSVGKPGNFINSDVALDSEPIIGSFTVDGLTFAVTDGPYVELVGVSPSVILSEGSEAAGAEEYNSNHASEAGATNLTLPETVSYKGVSHIVSSIGAYAFYLSGVTSVTLPASVSDVDDRAFRSSDVASVTVAEGNPAYSSFDGALYDAECLSLLLIPEGKQGAVLLPKTAEAAEASVFSHCPLVDSTSVEKDGAAFASENGLLYDSDLTTLLRVPAGATEITIREGCTTIAAGALEACAKLTTINAPATVTSISPDVFHAIPTVSFPAATLAEDAPQLTAMISLFAAGDDIPEAASASIQAILPEGADAAPWQDAGLVVSALASATTGRMAPTQYHSNTAGGLTITVSPASPDQQVQEYWTRSGGIVDYPAALSHLSLNHPRQAPLDCSHNITRAIFVSEYGVLVTKNGNQEDPWLFNDAWALYALTDSFSETSKGLVWRVESDAHSFEELKDKWVTLQDGEAFRLYGPSASVSFDTDSEPGDVDYPGADKPDQTVNVESGPTVIEDPKRPGYVFQGWTIPNAGGTEAIDQDLVYQGDDGKWYVDASKLPDYAGDDGRVELTARWTSVISVDVPSSVTFYADVVTQGNESREGLASSAFGQSKVQSQSEVGLRIVGLESKQVKGNGSTSLGASDILKKKDGSDLPATSDKLFSLYPATGELTEDDLKDPDATSASKPEGAVDFSLDDILLEKSFAADKFTIPAGDTLSLGYRLNLQETSTALDYDKLSTLSEGSSASIANISYCFAADYGPVFWTADDDGSTLELASIKADAEKIAAGDASTISKYTAWMNADHRFYVKWYDQGVAEADNPTKATVYDVRIIGLNHDDKSDGSGKAGITFQFVNGLNDVYPMSMSKVNTGGWGASDMLTNLNSGQIWGQMPAAFKQALAEVNKEYYAGPVGLSATLESAPSHCFLLSFTEISAKNFPSGWSRLADEGSLYAWWKSKDINAQGNNQAAIKGFQRDPEAGCSWWLRSAYPTKRNNFVYVNTLGQTWDGFNYDTSLPLVVSPCFCM